VNDRAAEVQACLEPRADEMAGLLEELIARDTENPPGRRLSECGRLPERTDVPAYADVDCKCAARKQRDRTSGEARERADREHGPGSHPATSVPRRFSSAFRCPR
jgi:hypothetical protein